MADEKPEAAPEKPRKGKTVVIIISLAIVLATGAVTALYFFSALSPSEKAMSAGDVTVEIPSLPEQDELVYVPLDPAFTVNLQGGARPRFLQANIQVVTREQKMAEHVVKHMPVIRNALVMLFSSKDAEDLDSREGKENLRVEALAAIQEVLREKTGSQGVEGVFFTSFVMQ